MNIGWLGVDFFFVLSGFIIMHVHRDDPGTLRAATEYVRKRLWRIFPAFWPVSIALLIGFALVPTWSTGKPEQISIWSSLLLLPNSGTAALGVSWSLMHEMLFYMVFLLFFVSHRLFWATMAIWMAATFLVPPEFAKIPAHSVLELICSPINAEFACGLAVALLIGHQRCRKFLPGKSLLAAGVGMQALLLTLGYGEWDRLVFAPGFAIIVLGAIAIEVRRGPFHVGLLSRLGDASYSLYLTHTPVQSAIGRAGRSMGASEWPVLAVVFMTAISIAVGIAYHLVVERPIQRLLRRAPIEPKSPVSWSRGSKANETTNE